MISRDITNDLIDAGKQFPVIAVLGPRQSGKTTLVQNVFKDHKYISLEDLDSREIANKDPRRFLADYPSESGIVLDEVQNVPHLLSYIQTIVDREQKMGYFILTGSQNLMVHEAITQTLAGRIAILTLFPFSINELSNAGLLPDKIENAAFNGWYPRAYSDNISIEKLYHNYIRTYIERDVRSIKNVTDLITFQRFIALCAGRVGQLLNLTSLANDCGIDYKTAKAWLSILEASYIIFLIYPYYNNFGKRVIKAPKLYFVDTGILCSLLRLTSPEELQINYLRGNIIENLVMSDLLKQYYNMDKRPSLYFWRDVKGHEVDFLIYEAFDLVVGEIKSSKTVISDYFDQLTYFKKLADKLTKEIVVYAGDQNQNLSQGQILSWKFAGHIIKDLFKK